MPPFDLVWTDGTVTWYFFKMGDKTVTLKRDDFNTFSEDILRGLFEDSDFCDVTLKNSYFDCNLCGYKTTCKAFLNVHRSKEHDGYLSG